MKTERRSCCAISLALKVLSDLPGETALQCADLVRSGRHAEYLEYTVDESKYTDWREFFSAYIAVNLLRKFPFLSINVDREKVALESFLLSEQSCREANSRIASLYRDPHPFESRIQGIFLSAELKIKNLLGPFSWDLCERHFGFGPGATTDLGRRHGNSWYKFGLLRPSTTGLNAVLAGCAIAQSPQWYNHVSEGSDKAPWDCLTIVPGNRVTTVPKSAKTDRVIAIEPTMNMFVQKGIGFVIRRALKKVGINLDSQKRNQLLAKAGSEHGHLATIDLSSASDTICMKLVESLLPPDWVTAIKLCRSPIGALPDGSEIRYQKVSSMGNGFTFELESLIFWALSLSAVEANGDSGHDVAVYGDDIIVPVSSFDLVVEVLSYAGFKTNLEKTFATGPFRESCGKHYFHGHDVTPIYIKDRVDDTERLLWMCNSIRRLAHRFLGYQYGCEGLFRSSYEAARKRLPPQWRRPRIPENFGDGALCGDFDEVLPQRAKGLHDAFRVSLCLVRVYSSFTGSGVPMLLTSLFKSEGRGVSSQGIAPGVDTTQINKGWYRLHSVKSMQVQRWEGLGPWIDFYRS